MDANGKAREMSQEMMEKGLDLSKSNGLQHHVYVRYSSGRCTIECFIHKRRTKPACLS